MNFVFPNDRDFKVRKCFNCKKIIDFGDYYIRNKKIDQPRLIKLWENENLEFYCCLCYDTLMNSKKIQELNNSLDERDKEIIKILKLKLSIQLPIVPKIEYDSVGVTIADGKIIGMGLFKSLKEFPKEITELDSLVKLNLSWNSLEKLPKSIKNLKSLKSLDLIGNKLNYLPNEIGQLNFLEDLDLSFNEFSYIPESIVRLSSLKTLNLIHNKILKIPESIKNLEKNGLKILI